MQPKKRRTTKLARQKGFWKKMLEGQRNIEAERAILLNFVHGTALNVETEYYKKDGIQWVGFPFKRLYKHLEQEAVFFKDWCWYEAWLESQRYLYKLWKQRALTTAGFIVYLMKYGEGGKGMTKQEAIRYAAEIYGIKYATQRQYLSDDFELRRNRLRKRFRKGET